MRISLGLKEIVPHLLRNLTFYCEISRSYSVNIPHLVIKFWGFVQIIDSTEKNQTNENAYADYGQSFFSFSIDVWCILAAEVLEV